MDGWMEYRSIFKNSDSRWKALDEIYLRLRLWKMNERRDGTHEKRKEKKEKEKSSQMKKKQSS